MSLLSLIVFGPMNPLTRRLVLLGNSVQRPFLRRRLGQVILEEVDGVSLIVLPEVFNPVVFRTGTVLARTVASSPWAKPHAEGSRALDLGTGSGVGAVFAARRGHRVTAVDLNPEAVRCARLNALLHRLEDRIEAREGDLFEPVAGEVFDLILFNPPFFRGEPRSRLDLAWRGTDVLERFAVGLPAALAPGGVALLLLSTDGDGPALLEALARQGFTIESAARRNFGNEVVTVHAVRRALS
jgi:HemK-related putative methylase